MLRVFAVASTAAFLPTPPLQSRSGGGGSSGSCCWSGGHSSCRRWIGNTVRYRCSADAVTMQLFANPFEKLAEQMLGPTEGPISLAKQNFARPTWEEPALRELSVAPPVYMIDGFMSDEECDACRNAALTGAFPAVPYGAKNKIFTGTKWAAHMQHESVDLFLERTCTAFGGLSPDRFDPVTVTKYGPEQYQAKHLDARLPHQINRNAAYLATGGQRIAQLICYLQAPEAGGETKFFGPAFGGTLAVTPKKGSALIFPTATLDGLADERYLHSGEPVAAGDKWIVGTWLMEAQRTDAKDVQRAIDELWKLEGKQPPVRTAAKAAAAASGAAAASVRARSTSSAATKKTKQKKRAKGKKKR